MLRSITVSGRRPFAISARVFGAQVENTFGSWSSPTVRMTFALERLWPELMIPRSSSRIVSQLSASSRMSVGEYLSTTRKMTVLVTFDEEIARWHRALSISSSVVFPHRIVGLITASIDDTSQQGMR